MPVNVTVELPVFEAQAQYNNLRICIPVFSTGERFTNIFSLFGFIKDRVDAFMQKSVKKVGIADWQKKDVTFDALALPKSMVDIWTITGVDIKTHWNSDLRCMEISLTFLRSEFIHSEYITKLYYKV
jgi:hypothetical protein